MLSGSDIRRYRKMLGMTQADFARQLGLAQATLSQIEGGRIALSDEHVQQLDDRFRLGKPALSFKEFKRDAERSMASNQAALSAPHGRYTTFVVWPVPPGEKRISEMKFFASAVPEISDDRMQEGCTGTVDWI